MSEREKVLVRKVILDSSMVEHTAVNRGVVGSSPTRGAGESCKWLCLQDFFCIYKRFVKKGMWIGSVSLLFFDFKITGKPADRGNYLRAFRGYMVKNLTRPILF